MKQKTPVGAYSGTPHKTIEQLVEMASRRAAAGETPFGIIQDIVDGYDLRWQSANHELIKKAATTITKHFPDSTIGVVHQNGAALSTREKGVTATLTINESGTPIAAEVYGDSEEHYAEMGLSFDGKQLVDYDGVFELPKEVATMLRELGFTVEEAE